LIDSLKKNKEAKETLLYIVSDAASRKEDICKVLDIREYISEIEGFKDVILIARKQNLGSHYSILSSIEEVFEDYDKLIFLEDDNFVSQNFLSFMNDALNKYKNFNKIFSVSGYNYPIKIPKEYNHSVYLYQGFSAWGVGIWKEKWKAVEWKLNDKKIFLDLLKNKKAIKNSLGESVFWSIKSMAERQHRYADAYICYHLYKTNMYSVFPTLSKVRNYGHDGLGEHGRISSLFINQIIDESNSTTEFPLNLGVDEKINKELKNYFKISRKSKIKMFIKDVLFKKSIKKEN